MKVFFSLESGKGGITCIRGAEASRRHHTCNRKDFCHYFCKMLDELPKVIKKSFLKSNKSRDFSKRVNSKN